MTRPAPRDVILIFDETIRPPGPKMVVCAAPRLGLFFRINSRPRWQIPVPLVRLPHHPFLDHDSFLECGDPLELDDYIVDESLRRHGVLGRISETLLPEICAIIVAQRTLPPDLKAALVAGLGCA